MFRNPDRNRGNTNFGNGRHKRLVLAGVMAMAVIAGGVWFTATPEANGLTLDRQDKAADAAYRTQHRGQQLAASHGAIREAFQETVPLASGEAPDQDRHGVVYARSGIESERDSANPAEAVAPPAKIIPREGERLVTEAESAFVTDGAPGSREEAVDRYEAKVNDGREDTPAQAKVTRRLDLWAPRYHDARAAHKLLDDSVTQAKAYSESYFDSQTQRIARLDSSTRNYANPHGRISELLNNQRNQYERWATQADATLRQSESLLKEMNNVNEAMQFAQDAAGYHAMVKDAIVMEDAMQALAADLTGFEDNTLALMNLMDGAETPTTAGGGG